MMNVFDIATNDPITRTGVDLTSCDREPIHLLGNIQPFGFLLVVSDDWTIRYTSNNTQAFLRQPPEALIGTPLNTLFSREAIHAIRGRVQLMTEPDVVERLFSITLLPDGPEMDVSVHRVQDAVVIEAEQSVKDTLLDPVIAVRSLLMRLQRTLTTPELCRQAVGQLRALTGYDRVMAYKFYDDGSGEVIAEASRFGMEPYLGLRFPASDIPKQARALYLRNWLRLIEDVNDTPVPILPAAPPGEDPPDLSMSCMRAVSPIHIEYLKNMGVTASLSVSIIHHGRLWGLFACHHTSPRYLSCQRRTAVELFAQMFSLILDSRERETSAAHESQARRLHNNIMTKLANNCYSFENISSLVDDLAEIIPCDGIGIYVNGQVTLKHLTPNDLEFKDLVQFLTRNASNRIYATNELGRGYPNAHTFSVPIAGMLAIPISRTSRDYLVFFRKEVTTQVVWAGNPHKAVFNQEQGEDEKISPRTSFEAWREVVQGKSTPWSEMDCRVAESLRVTLLEVILRLTDLAEKERKSAQERQELLIAELNHRVRNILGLIRGLVSQSRDNVHTVEAFADVLGERIQSLARAHDQITSGDWRPVALQSLIESEVMAYLGTRASRVQTTGPNVLMEPQAFSTTALVVHELVTNSVKYGALSVDQGQVIIQWETDENGDLLLHWEEKNGPPVQPPTRRGFGTTIIERSIPFDLKGDAHIEYLLMGVRATFRIPAAFIKLEVGTITTHLMASPHQEEACRTLALQGDVLLVEDNMIIALDAEAMLHKLGAQTVNTASTVQEALQIIDHSPPSLAILDVNLGLESSFPVAARLQTLGIPFLFATGYGDDIKYSPEYQAVTVITKPYNVDTFRQYLTEMFQLPATNGASRLGYVDK